ncbi:hypothetical protein [Methylobacter sp. S3L5C]|uniref:LBF_2804 family protein n=1 Tax=Methylobacter sp. S3L5C TaxID=2839024 RepID=UPI001FAC71DD|nr:hypothetical protein [Methylobacter sp. S3L5C]UOA07874.1 hypothetical protein KKZ03_16710 [Methylobacter sp. S3L5C]
MSQNTSTTKKSNFQRKNPAGFLEDRDVKYYQYLAKKSGITNVEALVAIDDLPSDDNLSSAANNITHFAAFIAFGIGALTTVVSVWFEWKYAGRLDDFLYYSGYLLVISTMLALEMTVLFWLGLRTVHQLACLTGHHDLHDDPLLNDAYTVPNMLARAALEVPDPVIHYLGIDPLKHVPKSGLLFIGLLYKAKVLLSSLFIKFVCVRVFGKGSSRLGFAWVAIPVTGIWDAVVMYKVAREARLRLFGNRLARHITDEIMQPEFISQLSAKAKEGAIRAVATMMILSQNHHPNMLVLLIELCKNFETDERCEYDNWADFLTLLNEVSLRERYFILDLLSVSAAFDGHLSRLERHHLPQAFGEHTEVYMLRIEALKEALLSGRLHKAKQLCLLDFEPG